MMLRLSGFQQKRCVNFFSGSFQAFLYLLDKALWHLVLPMIFSNITVPLLGLDGDT